MHDDDLASIICSISKGDPACKRRGVGLFATGDGEARMARLGVGIASATEVSASGVMRLTKEELADGCSKM